MQFGLWNFQPGLWPTIATLLMLPLLISLGFWQLDRADQKERVMQHFEQNRNEVPLNMSANMLIDPESMQWQRLKAEGRFDSTFQFLLDNQPMNSGLGYYVYTAFLLPGSKRYILVNRGWVAANPDRRILPNVTVTADSVSIIGAIKHPPGTGILLSEDLTEYLPNNIVRLQQINIEQIETITGKPFLPFILRLEEESSAGYARNWHLPGSGVEKHYGYAFQWFAMALAVLIIYLVLNTKKTKVTIK